MAASRDLPRDIGEFIRELRRNARISLRQLADQAGVSNPYLSQIERGLRRPSAAVLQQLASALRVSTPLMYLRAGLLDAAAGPGVLAAIAADPDLSVSQKQALTQIYETFRRESSRSAQPAEEAATATTPAETTSAKAASAAKARSAKAASAARTAAATEVSQQMNGSASARPHHSQRPAMASTARQVPVRRTGSAAQARRTTKGATSPRTAAPEEESP